MAITTTLTNGNVTFADSADANWGEGATAKDGVTFGGGTATNGTITSPTWYVRARGVTDVG